MDFSVIIENYQENENPLSPYEKQFNSNTTIMKVLQEFGLDSAFVVNVKKEIIKPQTTLNEIKIQNDCAFIDKKLFLKLISSHNCFPTQIKFKYYLKDPNNKSNRIEWDIQIQDMTLYSYFENLNIVFEQIIHKNKSINPLLRLKDIKINKDDEVEFSILDKQLEQNEILVIIYADQYSQQVGSYNIINNYQQREEGYQHLSQVDEGFEMKEQILYYEVEKKSATIESILLKLNNQNIFALQSSKGVLDSKKTLDQYFKMDLQCKLLVIQNKLEVKNIQIEEGKILVNVFQNGQLILRRLFNKNHKIIQIEKFLSKEIKGDINFIMADKDVLESYYDLCDFEQDEIYLEVIIKQVDYDGMEAVLKQALKQVQELKQKNIEIKQESINPMYKKIIQKDQTINRLQQIIEQQRYKEDEQDIILKIQTIHEVQSGQIYSTQF